MTGRYFGVVTGLVTDVSDPEGMGRIRVELTCLEAGNQSAWARLANPLAGADRGGWFLPEVGDEALVAFEMGDINQPYVLGFLWNGDSTPPETDTLKRVLKTVSGHKITFDDNSGSETILIEDSSGVNKITLDKDGISIETTGDFKVKAKTVKVEADTTMELKASAKLSVKGSPVHLNP
jgi:uncharacterized protein involved in type VI secretion and phage assembly